MAYITVSSNTELTSAISKAVGGDTILLAPGSYSTLNFYNRAFSANVTVTSLDPLNRAHVDKLAVGLSQNLTFTDLDLGRGLLEGEPDYTALNVISKSKNITLDNVKLHGSLDHNAKNDGKLLAVSDGDNITLRNSELTEGYRGAVFERSTNLTLTGNTAHLLRSDGFNFAAVQKVLIQGNKISGFDPVTGDHPDAIQFWTSGTTTASADITIRNNIVMQPDGFGSQGIFMRDELGTLAYTNVTIENNLLYSNGGAWHGISVEHVIGGRLANNTVLSTTTDAMRYWIGVTNSQNIDLVSNLTDQLNVVNSTDIRTTSNISLTLDPALKTMIPNLDAGYYAEVSDLVVSGYGYQIPATSDVPPTPIPSPAPVAVPAAPNLIYGTSQSDAVQGTAGSDKIWGIAATGTKLGKGTVDKLSGSGGNDVFVLGDDRGIFYNDGNGKSAGKGDYVQIMDFQVGDKIQLRGAEAKYLFVAGVVNNQSGMQIFYDSNGNESFDTRDELIGHIVGFSSVSLDAFVFA